MNWIEQFWAELTAVFVAPVDMPEFLQCIVLVWLTSVGAALGSFMNVVVYRVPAGLSVVRPASRCPKCLHPIRSYDNIPILSWFVLRGRCRDCASPIAGRYPVVEALVAVVTAIVALAELFPLDWLPSDWVPHGRAAYAGYSAWWIWGSHLLLILTLLAAAIIEFDGMTPPIRLFVPAFLVGLVTIVVWPESGTLVANSPPLDVPPWAMGLLSGVAGAGLGSFLGRFLPACEDRLQRRGTLAYALAIAGVAWGISAVFVIALAYGAAIGVWRAAGRIDKPPFPPLGLAVGTAIVLTVVARWL